LTSTDWSGCRELNPVRHHPKMVSYH